MGSFSQEDIDLAKQVQDKYGVPASVTLGQYALESGYGSKTVGQNNYFNIKGNGNGGYSNYSSKAESFDDYGRLLSTDRYTSKTSSATKVEDYIQGVKDAGYAEDPHYVGKVMNIINTNNLMQYDTGNLGTDYSGSGGLAGTISEASGNAMKWFGDITKVLFCILLLIGGFVFIALAFTTSDTGSKTVKKLTKVKGVKKK